MAIEKREFAKRASRYFLKAFHDKVITYSNKKVGMHKSTDFLDISSTGLAFVTQKENTPDHGSIIRITFTVPGKTPISIKAQVVRVADYKRPKWYKKSYDRKEDKVIEECFIGVNFMNLSDSKMSELDVYLEHLIEKEKSERTQQKLAYVKNEFKKSYKWLIVSVIGIIALGVSLKLYFG